MTAPVTPNGRGTPTPHDQHRWLELINGLDIDTLCADLVLALGDTSDCRSLAVPHSEVVRSCRHTIGVLLEVLRGNSSAITDSATLARKVGVLQARAGVPEASLLAAIYRSLGVIWAGLQAVSDQGDAALLVRHTALLMRALSDYTQQVQQAYASEVARMREEHSAQHQDWVTRVFAGTPPDPAYFARISAMLGLRVGTPILVAAAVRDDIPQLRVAFAELEHAQAKTQLFELDEAVIGFTQSASLPGTQLNRRLGTLVELRIGLTFASQGLAGLQQAAHIARELAHAFYPGETGAMTWARGWARLAANHLLAAGSPIMSDVHDALDTCGPAEQMRLEEAVRSYLRTGSVTDSAAELFCHRNTLTNRLRRFAELTGVDPTVPEQAARLVVGWA